MSLRTPSRTTSVPAVTVALAAGALLLSATVPAHATATLAQIATSRSTGVSYLKSLQGADGSYVTGGGLSNEWAFSALAAAGTAAAGVTPGGDAGRNARLVYRNQLAAPGWPGSSPVVTDYERGILNTYAAGIDPARVGPGRNLVADLVASWQSAEPGYYGPSANFNGTVFGLLALAGARTQAGTRRAPQPLIDASVTAVRANQHNDGGWNYSKAAGNPTALAQGSDIDMTGAAMASLCAGGVPSTDPAIVSAKNFLKGKLVSSGAFNSMWGANTDSNGWAVSGLNACGINPQGGEFTSGTGKTPVDFLVAQQFKPGGGFKYLPTDTVPSPYASVDGLRAVAGAGFTATPPAPTTAGEPTWAATGAFAPGTAARLALVVDDGTGALRACAVTLTPTGTTTTLGDVLDAAAAATPNGCVTSVTPSTGGGAVTMINGTADSGSSTWKVSLDGSAATGATRTAPVRLGDTVSLRLGS
ncbi:terpene cyclase/mutase family protein [Kitasatospora sp. RG8]|uniref:prenyltransferase/squalene oxidase repeat-containing protein n=1 Tax=Kitasatospora sp. RG8 TaxID=2820815 RepID=UPI001ADFB364|nr:prenyltransferase/squalene oxidase repeat-containing protein [Kitasatospora sp. RG8]MBP0450697.1 terpene cyclase/mutase family protein [Kitasatospora sp. RG8]